MKSRLGIFILTACAAGITYSGWVSTARAQEFGGFICSCEYDVDCDQSVPGGPFTCEDDGCTPDSDVCVDIYSDPCTGDCYGTPLPQ
jgi:hypothetical protein